MKAFKLDMPDIELLRPYLPFPNIGFPHGLQLISLFSTTILFSSYGKKPSDLTVGPNTATAGVPAAIAICIAPRFKICKRKHCRRYCNRFAYIFPLCRCIAGLSIY